MVLRKQRKNNAVKYMGIFVVVIMVASTFGYVLYFGFSDQDTSTYTYNNQEFSFANGLWITSVDGQQITLPYHPSEVEHLTVSESAQAALQNGQFFFMFDPKDPFIGTIEDIRLSLQTIAPAVLGGELGVVVSDVHELYPFALMDCSTEEETLRAFFHSGNTTAVEENEGCVEFIAETEYNTYLLYSALVYQMTGIIGGSSE